MTSRLCSHQVTQILNAGYDYARWMSMMLFDLMMEDSARDVSEI